MNNKYPWIPEKYHPADLERNIDIFFSRVNGETYASIAKRYGFTRNNARNIYKKLDRFIREYLYTEEDKAKGLYAFDIKYVIKNGYILRVAEG